MHLPPRDPSRPDETTAQYGPSPAAPPFPPFPPEASAPPAGAVPPAGTVAPEPVRREPSLVQRTLPFAIAAILGGAVAGGIVAAADGLRGDPKVVVAAPSAGSAQAEASPATPTPTPTTPATPQGGQGAAPNSQPPAQGQPAQASGGWLGVAPSPVDTKLAGRVKLQAETGVMIADVVAGSPAEQAGFAKADSHITIDGTQYAFGGDIVTAIDGEPVRTVDDLRRILAAHEPGDTIEVQVVHADGNPATLDVTLGERPQAGGQAPPTSTLPGGFEIPGGFPEGG